MSDEEFERFLAFLLDNSHNLDEDTMVKEGFEDMPSIFTVTTFSEALLMTNAKGVIVKTVDNSTFQITIKKVR